MASTSPSHHLHSPQVAKLHWMHQSSTTGKQKQVLWGAPLEKLGCWVHKPTLSFPWESLGARESLSDYMALC